MADSSAKARPKLTGVRKGGTRFPRHSLEEVVAWAKKLVVKTHLGPQKKAVVLSGVVGNNGSQGEVRISSLKQFALLEGDATAYKATDLAKRISAAPIEEIHNLYQESALSPTVFAELHNTFQGDIVTKAKIKQRAAALEVHPDSTDDCVERYVASMVLAGLCTLDGENISHIVNSGPRPKQAEADEEATRSEDASNEDAGALEAEKQEDSPMRRPARAAINVTISLDSTLDTEKLEKQLRLLKQYGAI